MLANQWFLQHVQLIRTSQKGRLHIEWIFKSCLFKVEPDIKDEWINVSNDIERFDDQDLFGYQTLLTQYEKFKTKIRNGELGKTAQFWLIYLDLMQVQHLAHTAVRENDFNMRARAWEKMLLFYFYFNKTNYARIMNYTCWWQNEWVFKQHILSRLQSTNEVNKQSIKMAQWQVIYKYFSGNNFKRQYLDLLK